MDVHLGEIAIASQSLGEVLAMLAFSVQGIRAAFILCRLSLSSET